MGFANVKGLKVIKQYENGRKRWYVEYNGDIVSDPFRSRTEALQSLQPIFNAILRYGEGGANG